VWGQTGSAEKADWVSRRGADRVVVATDAAALVDVAAELRPTVVFDPLGGSFTGAAIELLRTRGRLVIFGTSSDARGEVPLQALYRKAISVYGYAGLIEDADTLARGVEVALAAERDGLMQIEIDRVLPLDAVNDAFALLASRAVRGKILIDLANLG
jgi:NADPH2:quinone reductase